MRLIDADALIEEMSTVMDMQDTYLPIHFKEWLIDEAPTIEPNLILPERMERGDIYEVGETIVVMNHDDYYDLLCKSWVPKHGEWILCSERLPSESGRYLCTYAEIQRGEYISCIDFGSFINGEWYTSGVIAWMPMPDPYGEREGE